MGGKKVLSALSLSVPQRSCLALIGPSGCGKSTILRLILGLLAPDAGVTGCPSTSTRPASVRTIRRRIGYVVQDGGLFPHMTAAENAAVMARELGYAQDRIDARIAELAALVSLEPSLLARYPGELSGGQRQRVGLMRALMLDPVLLLLDEPMAALDPMVRRRLQEDLKRVFATIGRTVLLVTHDLAEAGYLGDEVALMRDGKILQRGPMRALVEEPADPFVVEFVRAQRALHEPTEPSAWRATA
jgi:osmoprotectant transport system ATP-binding protein